MHCRAWLVRYLRSATVTVMESAKVWSGDNCAGTIFDLPRYWCVAVEAHVTAYLVVIGLVLQDSPEKMSLAKCDDVVSALSTDGSNDALS